MASKEPRPIKLSKVQLQQRAKTSYYLVIGLYIALLGLETAWLLLLAPPVEANRFVIWGIVIAPLALFLPVILKPTPKRLIWFCFLLLVYLCFSLVTCFLLPALKGRLALMESLLLGVLFSASMLAARWHSQLARVDRDKQRR